MPVSLSPTGFLLNTAILMPLSGVLTACSFRAGAYLPDAGTDLAAGPTIVRPSNERNLAPARTLLLWRDGPVPAGESISGYQLCAATGSQDSIDEAAECPDALSTSLNRVLRDPLQAGTRYYFKTRAQFSGGGVSDYGPLFDLTTDASQTGWWLLNGDGNDSGSGGKNGALRGTAGFAAGFIADALSLDGNGSSLAVPSAPEHNFGTGDFTVSAWIHPARDGFAEAIAAKRSASNGYELFRTAGGQLAFFGAGCGIAVSGGSVPKNAWNRVAAVRSAGTVFLYVNEAPAGSAACADDFANAASLSFGCLADLGCAEPFQGLIDDVSLRNAATEPSAIRDGYCADQAAAGIDPLPAPCNP